MIKKITFGIITLFFSNGLNGMDPHNLVIPLNPRVTFSLNLNRTTTLRLLALSLGACGTLLTHQAFKQTNNATTQQPDVTTLSAGALCYALSFLIAYATHDQNKQ